MTYSIVARDPGTGELGVAVQSAYFTVGPVVPWAEAGVGAVATQSLVNVAFGPAGLELLRAGFGAARVVEALIAADSDPDGRQLAAVDATGSAAAHTGPRCIAAAGHHVGEGYSCQANLMERDTVWQAMAEAYEGSGGQPLPERLITALRAAEAEGGDIRGRQSAAIVVVAGTPTGRPWDDRTIDLRVDDHPEPVEELARLLRIRRAFQAALGGERVLSGGGAGLLEARRRALEIAPEMVQLRLMAGVAYAQAGDWARALELVREVLRVEPRFLEALGRMAAAGRVPAGIAEQLQARL